MEKAVTEIKKTTSVIEKMAKSNIDQSNSTDQINAVMQELNQMIQQNAQEAEVLVVNYKNMSEQANKMKEILTFFKLS